MKLFDFHPDPAMNPAIGLLHDIFGPMYDAAGKLPTVRGVPLAALLEQYDSVQAMLRDVCSKKTDEDLESKRCLSSTATTQRFAGAYGIWRITAGIIIPTSCSCEK